MKKIILFSIFCFANIVSVSAQTIRFNTLYDTTTSFMNATPNGTMGYLATGIKILNPANIDNRTISLVRFDLNGNITHNYNIPLYLYHIVVPLGF
jgi:hypothetical protein